jgi:hypothetical protein
MSGRQVVLVSQSELSFIEGLVMTAVQRWHSDWSPLKIDISLDVRAVADDLCNRASSQTEQAVTSGVWVVGDAHWCELIQRELGKSFSNDLDGVSASRLSKLATDAIFKDCVERLLGAEVVESSTLHRVAALPTFALGAGYVIVRLFFAGYELKIATDLIAKIRSAKARSPRLGPSALVDLLTAARQERVKAEVQIPSLEMTVGELSTLSIGDTVRLDWHPRTPLALKLDGGHQLVKGSLVALEGQRAFRVLN